MVVKYGFEHEIVKFLEETYKMKPTLLLSKLLILKLLDDGSSNEDSDNED